MFDSGNIFNHPSAAPLKKEYALPPWFSCSSGIWDPRMLWEVDLADEQPSCVYSREKLLLVLGPNGSGITFHAHSDAWLQLMHGRKVRLAASLQSYYAHALVHTGTCSLDHSERLTVTLIVMGQLGS